MCGFAGFHAARALPENVDSIARGMGDRLQPRGPDDYGQWIDPALGIVLAFRRLAIVDLSQAGHQPMRSANGRFVLAVNGEIYNHRRLRATLEMGGHCFRGHSDAEVLLEAIAAQGLDATLDGCVGMFALALIDTQERRLMLARDRLGEKPLFYGWDANCFFFGSELRAFRAHPGFAPSVDRGALTHYVRHGYVPSPQCIFSGFHKLEPGSILSIPLDGSATPENGALRHYWTIPKPEPAANSRVAANDYVAGLEDLLQQAVGMQMLADVPVGAFLSGGIDSSTVVSVMQAQATVPVRTFSIGFPEARLDESGHAARIAAHLGTEHTEWRCVDSEVLQLAELVPRAYSEPFADDSQLPTLALSRLARQQVTVCLSGDGGDELFYGYGRYARTLSRWQQLGRHPHLVGGLRRGLRALCGAASLLTESPFKRHLTSRLKKARSQWTANHLPAFYRHRVSVLKTPDLFLSRPEVTRDFFDEAGENGELTEAVSSLSYLDLHTYLLDHILAKVDRAAMAFGLETRIPLLDYRIVEYAAKAPAGLQYHEGTTKWPLRQILARRVPPSLTERPKQGFSTPMSRWLRGPLRDWGEAQLAPGRLRDETFFQPEEVRRLWTEHQLGRRDRAPLLWNFLVFQAWYAEF